MRLLKTLLGKWMPVDQIVPHGTTYLFLSFVH